MSRAIAPARALAFATIRQTFEEDAFTERAFRAGADRLGLAGRDRAQAQRLAYGAVQRRGTSDAAIERLADRSVRLLSVSFDVANETAGTLRGYARTYHADAARWTIAVPANARDTEALLQSLGVVVIPDGFGGYVHNGAIHLLDARGRLRGLYALDDWQQALEAAQRLAANPHVARR